MATVAALVDTNVLVYAIDAREPEKQAVAVALLNAGIAAQALRVPHQAVVEFVAAVPRPRRGGGPPVLAPPEAWRAAEELLDVFEVLYPDAEMLRLAVRGAAAYQLSWFDAHLWAYAEYYGLDTLYSEDFQHGRRYGRVRVINPFV
jgi:predicted nucleic acid-binding protein